MSPSLTAVSPSNSALSIPENFTSQIPGASPQHSHHSVTQNNSCWPATLFNSCRQHVCSAYLSRLTSLFSRAPAKVDAEPPSMFSMPQSQNRAVAPSKSTHNNMQPSRGFGVRIFKGPTLSSFPYTAMAKFDVGYRPAASNDPRQNSQSWQVTRTESSRQPLANIREPPQPSNRYGSFTENRLQGRVDTRHPSNYADFIYERSDIYSENDTASTFTPSSTFSPALSRDTGLTSVPSEVPFPTSATPSPPRNAFPLHIPALAQAAQSTIRGLFTQFTLPFVNSSNPDLVPATPVARTSELPTSSPPRFLPPEASNNPYPLSESPQPMPMPATGYFPPPPSESDVGEAQRLAERNAAQYNAASSAYYQEGFRAVGPNAPRGREISPERAAQLGSSARSMASSSFQGVMMNGEQAQGGGVQHVVYETSSIVTNPPSLNGPPPLQPQRVSPPSRMARAPSEASSVTESDSSSITAVEPDARFPSRGDARGPTVRSVPVSQLIELDSPAPMARQGSQRGRAMSDLGRYDELRGLNMRQREAYYSAFAAGTQQVPAVVRSDSGDSRASVNVVPERARRSSGNLGPPLPAFHPRRSPPQAASRPASTPPLPRIDTSVGAPMVMGQSPAPPPRRESVFAPGPPPPIATAASRSRTPMAGPRVLPAEPQRRRSDGDQPIGLLKRTSAIFHRSSSPDHSSSNHNTNGNRSPPRETVAARPTRPGALPLEPQRRRSDVSVVPPRLETNIPAPPQQPVVVTIVAPPGRNVRWNDNLICPSPIWASQRRKGWYNRRGDQLWTNDGAYKPPPQGQEYPSDLRDYPPSGSGWMNEDGVRIDMGHRLIPKVPLRSALKRTPSARGPVVQVETR
ncbi:hypothetical protein R3P38DRAFT_2612345 [Favolaschia claudopus]|uniref:Proteophosphoglycan ppg4 n=1 Tax=Favolaschia claudopus TaxID=2862362 RepID=A0AAW0CL20_9AGAR